MLRCWTAAILCEDERGSKDRCPRPGEVLVVLDVGTLVAEKSWRAFSTCPPVAIPVLQLYCLCIGVYALDVVIVGMSMEGLAVAGTSMSSPVETCSHVKRCVRNAQISFCYVQVDRQALYHLIKAQEVCLLVRPPKHL